MIRDKDFIAITEHISYIDELEDLGISGFIEAVRESDSINHSRLLGEYLDSQPLLVKLRNETRMCLTIQVDDHGYKVRAPFEVVEYFGPSPTPEEALLRYIAINYNIFNIGLSMALPNTNIELSVETIIDDTCFVLRDLVCGIHISFVRVDGKIVMKDATTVMIMP